MRYSKLSLLIPCALLLSACTTVTPAYKDNGPRIGACVEGGPDSVAQQFYDYRIQHHSNQRRQRINHSEPRCAQHSSAGSVKTGRSKLAG